jgi:hypothetical protein
VRKRAFAVLVAAASAAVLGLASAGWTCVPVATFTATPEAVRAGDEVTVSGIRFIVLTPVTIRLHGLDGPVVATVEMTRASNTLFKTTFRVPPDTRPGPLVVVAEQDASPEMGATNWGVPARTVVTVLDAAGNAPPVTKPPPLARPASLERESVGGVSLVLVALGMAGVALLVVGVAAVIAARPPRQQPPAPVVTAEADGRSEA